MNTRKLLAALRGMAGALLGACLSARLWKGAVSVCCRYFGWAWKPALLLGLGVCPAACLGYWCFRGLRERRFARCAVWLCAFLGLPLAVSPEDRLGAGLVSAFFLFLSHSLGQERLLRYTDPAWYSDPRRIAAKRSGGGRCPSNRWGPDAWGRTVPASFRVNEGGGRVIYVEGETIRVEPRLAGSRAFSVRDAAGLIVGPENGYNVLYDARGEALARFCMIEKNAKIFAQYLRDRGVPFRSLSEAPREGPLDAEPKPAALGEILWEAVAEYAAELEERERAEELRHTDLAEAFPRFTLELRHTFPFGAAIGGGLGLGLVLCCVGFPIVFSLPEAYIGLGLKILLAAVLAVNAGTVALCLGTPFSPSLTVESGRIWLDRAFSGPREIRLEDIGGLRRVPSDECYILYDKKGKTLAKFSTRDDFGPEFMNFLTEHHIRLRSEK